MQAKYISYQETNAFSSAVLDYISGKDQLNAFYKYTPDFEGFAKAIANRNFKGDRSMQDILSLMYLTTRKMKCFSVRLILAGLPDTLILYMVRFLRAQQP
jgi:predicted nucleotidyltransferase